MTRINSALGRPSLALSGVVTAPGDKSMSHRAIIFGALAEGETRITGLLTGADIMSTIGVMRALGAWIDEDDNEMWIVKGCGARGLRAPETPLDCGNAGTGARLIMGAVAAYPITATFTGDASLSSRPMGRVLEPLSQMGVSYEAQPGGRLPVTLTSSGNLKPIDYVSPQASAQVKSAILLAGLGADGTTSITEAVCSRDHTENMLRAFGVKVQSKPSGRGALKGQKISLTGPARLKAANVQVPGDPSSAAFPIVAALIVPGSEITVKNVMMNPSRTGLFETLAEMGARIETDNFRRSGGEVMADITVRYSPLKAIDVPPARAASMIDEYPILAVAAAYASGETVMNGLEELRVKESDRLSATAELLKANGVKAEESADGLKITGTGPKGKVPGGGRVKTHHDHRIAMSGLVLGLGAQAPVEIDDASMIATSFPDFFTLMQALGADMSTFEISKSREA